MRRALGNAGKHLGDHRPGWGRRAGQRRQYLGIANDDDGAGCTGRWGATTSEDDTNDNGELPPARDIHQQGQALNYGREATANPITAVRHLQQQQAPSAKGKPPER